MYEKVYKALYIKIAVSLENLKYPFVKLNKPLNWLWNIQIMDPRMF